MEKLDKIAQYHDCGIVNAYKGETRTFFDTVNDDDVYAALGAPEFQAFVRLVEAIGTAEDDSCAA